MEHTDRIGRPPKYDDPATLEIAVDRYFKELDCPPTITGLALYLGFESRQSFYDYEKNEIFSYAIKRARLRVEHSYELTLRSGSPTGSIFALKNMGWKDQSEIDHTSKGEAMPFTLVVKPKEETN